MLDGQISACHVLPFIYERRVTFYNGFCSASRSRKFVNLLCLLREYLPFRQR
jgi:hypothetical protein